MFKSHSCVFRNQSADEEIAATSHKDFTMNDVMDMQVEPLESPFLNNLQQQLGVTGLSRGAYPTLCFAIMSLN